MTLSESWLRNVARKRAESHAGAKSQTLMGEDTDYIGVLGEASFAEYMGVPEDVIMELVDGDTPEGDRGIDYTMMFDFSAYPPHGEADKILTIDVKTARKYPKWILEKRGKVQADIYVVMQYFPDTKRDPKDTFFEARATPVKWTTGQILERGEIVDFGWGENHSAPVRDAFRMEILRSSYMGLAPTKEGDHGA